MSPKTIVAPIALALLVASTVGGCAKQTEPVRIAYEVADAPAKERLEVSYRNASKTALCLYPTHWPNAGGKIDQASERVALLVEGERLPIEDFNTGFCPGCKLRVEPGETVSAFISYSDFKLPERLADEPKVLQFEPMAFDCR